MAFTFEALPARYGDSLFLTFAEPRRTLRVLIDGGPSRVYEGSVKPRLAREAAAAGDDGLVLDAVMVSHIDEDHIKGVLDLLNELRDADEASRPRPWDIRWLLHNSFDALLDEGEGGAARALGGTTVLAGLGGAANLAQLLGRELDHTAELVLASYRQGSQLASLAGALQITRNPPDGSPIMSADDTRVLQFGSAKFRIVGPRKRELDKLRADWAKWRAEQAAKKKGPTKALAATLDESIPNLSSIVALVEHGGKTALITGDARSDYVYDGLDAAGLLKGGKLHVDILKLPHHGSIRNVTKGFLEEVTADHYVASGDGTYGNPDRETLELIAQVRGNAKYTIHITHSPAACDQLHEAWRRDHGKPPFVANRDGIGPLVQDWATARQNITVNFPTAQHPQITIAL